MNYGSLPTEAPDAVTTKRSGKSIVPRPSDGRSRPRFDLAAMLERRRASRELDQLLGLPDPYPNVKALYGCQGADDGH